MPEFYTYQTFINQSASDEIINILTDNNIPFELNNNENIGASIISFNDGTPHLELKIDRADFARADAAIEKVALEQIPLLEEDYFLFHYTKDELLNLAAEPDMWSKFDYFIAKHLLLTKHNEVTTSEIETLKQDRIEILSRPESNQSAWIKRGYVLAITGGLGFIIGMVILNHKRTLPNGESVYAYSETDRKHGKMIVRISIIFIVLYTCYIIYQYSTGNSTNHPRGLLPKYL
jgi:hypothetical protein